MNKRETHEVLQVLVAAFPTAPKLEPETVKLYAMALARFDLDIGMLAAYRIARDADRFPPVSRVIATCQAEVRRLDTYQRDAAAVGRGDEHERRVGLRGVARARAELAKAAEPVDVSYAEERRMRPGEFNARGPVEREPEPLAG